MSRIHNDYNFSMHLIRVSRDFKVKSGSVWMSSDSSHTVSVVTITNSTATELDRYPESVVFLEQGILKSLTSDVFLSKYTKVMTGDCPDLRLELSRWLHEKSGTIYTVLLRTTENDPLLVYTDGANVWSRRSSDWERSMKLAK